MPVGEWNTYEITAQGQVINALLNGQGVSKLGNAQRSPQGYIDLQNHHPGSRVRSATCGSNLYSAPLLGLMSSAQKAPNATASDDQRCLADQALCKGGCMTDVNVGSETVVRFGSGDPRSPKGAIQRDGAAPQPNRPVVCFDESSVQLTSSSARYASQSQASQARSSATTARVSASTCALVSATTSYRALQTSRRLLGRISVQFASTYAVHSALEPAGTIEVQASRNPIRPAKESAGPRCLRVP